HVRFLRPRRVELRRAVGRLALQLLRARRQLVGLRRQLELAAVELPGTPRRLAVGAGRGAQLVLPFREQLLARIELGARLRDLLLDRRNLCLALLEALKDLARFLTLLPRFVERPRVLLCLLFQLLHARLQRARLRRQLELALVELTSPCGDTLL